MRYSVCGREDLGDMVYYSIKSLEDNHVEAWAEVISVPSEAEPGSMGRSYRKVFLLIVKKNMPQSKLFKGRGVYLYEMVSSLSLKWRLESHTLR